MNKKMKKEASLFLFPFLVSFVCFSLRRSMDFLDILLFCLLANKMNYSFGKEIQFNPSQADEGRQQKVEVEVSERRN